jgi:hypothetical protein
MSAKKRGGASPTQGDGPSGLDVLGKTRRRLTRPGRRAVRSRCPRKIEAAPHQSKVTGLQVSMSAIERGGASPVQGDGPSGLNVLGKTRRRLTDPRRRAVRSRCPRKNEAAPHPSRATGRQVSMSSKNRGGASPDQGDRRFRLHPREKEAAPHPRRRAFRSRSPRKIEAAPHQTRATGASGLDLLEKTRRRLTHPRRRAFRSRCPR